jgi:hypothetical protein
VDRGRNSTTNPLFEPPNIRTSPSSCSSHSGGSPLANADAIADMASGDLICNLHLDDDNNGIQGCHLYMDTNDAIAVVNDVVAVDPPRDTVVDNTTVDS